MSLCKHEITVKDWLVAEGVLRIRCLIETCTFCRWSWIVKKEVPK